MIIQIGTEMDESRILWKHKESDDWQRADIDDLIDAYEGRPTRETISRADAIEVVRRYMNDSHISDADWHMNELEHELSNIPTDSPTGTWKGHNADNPDWLRTDGTPIFLVCDKCHGMVLNNGSANWNYCPNCGYPMKMVD